jgi:DNA-binding LacI/PurR family transcriptional regulator
VGTQAADLLLDRIDAEDDSDERVHVVIKPELIIRESCGASLLPEFRSRSDKAGVKT